MWPLRGHGFCQRTSLLVVRITRRVVTLGDIRSNVTMSSTGYPEFPAYSRLHRRSRLRRGLASNLRTVIVTAAVYRGLVLELRPKANPST